MFYRTVSGFRLYGFYLHVASLLFLAVMLAAYALFPAGVGWVVGNTYELLGVAPPGAVQLLVNWWGAIVVVSVVMVFGMNELLASSLVKKIELTPAHPQHERITRLVRNVAERAQIEVPVILIAGNKGMNAAAMRSVFHGRKLLIFEGILLLPDEQLEAVLAHEIGGHFLNWDLVARAPVAVMAQALFIHRILGYGAMGAALWSSFDGSFGVYVAFAATFIVFVEIFTRLFTFVAHGYSRLREYLADMGGVALMGAKSSIQLAAALANIKIIESGRFMHVDWTERFWRSHPPVTERVERLKDMATYANVQWALA